jgi:C4-dicarboxylate transporter, DctQ subunit
MFNQLVSRGFRILQKTEEFLLAWAMIGIALLTIGNVFSRTVFSYSLAFAEELSEFLIIFVTFIGLSYAASKGRHIRMTALYDQLSPKLQKVMMIVIAGSTCALMFLLAWYSLEYIASVHRLESASPVLQVPLYLVYLAAPLGLVLAGIQYALTVIRNLTQRDVYLSYEQKDEYEEVMSDEAQVSSGGSPV